MWDLSEETFNRKGREDFAKVAKKGRD